MLDAKKTIVRAASGAVYVSLIILACWWGDLGVTLLAGLLGSLGVSEFRHMRFPQLGNDSIGLYDITGALALIFAPLSTPYLPYPFLILWLIWLIVRMIIAIYSRHPHPEKEFSVDMAAQLYIAFPMALLTAMSIHSYAAELTCMPILSMFILIWINDTGAYIFGSTLGRHKMFERVSPKKSWEGLAGGMICTVAAGIAIGASGSPLSRINVANPTLFWGIGALVISVASTFGDLFESVIKRNLKIKDSGNLMPGHGGILDRIDSLLMVIPASLVYYICYRYISIILP